MIPLDVPATALSRALPPAPTIESTSYLSFKFLLRAIAVLAGCLALLAYLAKSGHSPLHPVGGAFIFLVVILSMCLLVCLGLLLSVVLQPQNHTKIIIKGTEKNISFINLFTKKVRSYAFDELDGIVSVYYLISTRSGQKKIYNIYLVKEGRRREKIASDSYTNFDALHAGLGMLKQSKFTDTLPAR